MTEPTTEPRDDVAEQPESVSDAPPIAATADLERESDIAADYIEGLLDVLDIAGDIDMDIEGVRATVSVVPDPDDPTALDALVGRDGDVLDALQDLARLAVSAQTGDRSRLMLDIARFRANRRAELAELTRSVVDEVRASGEAVRLDPMTPFERKVVHDTVAAAGLVSESDGEEPHRRVVVLPAHGS
ncbi:MAG: R3H domain-containing nucleic acid-binding protein [Jiangellales bacterium]